MEWVARKPDEHLACFGLRWCGVCGEAAVYRGDCSFCKKRRVAAFRRAHPLTLAAKAKQRVHARRWAAKQRRHGTEYYVRDKDRKRQRYANDPAFVAEKLEASRRRWRTRKEAA